MTVTYGFMGEILANISGIPMPGDFVSIILQPVKMENSELKPAVLRLKTNVVSHIACGEGYSKYIDYILKYS